VCYCLARRLQEILGQRSPIGYNECFKSGFIDGSSEMEDGGQSHRSLVNVAPDLLSSLIQTAELIHKGAAGVIEQISLTSIQHRVKPEQKEAARSSMCELS
jgi:hypothetical protein